MARNLRYIDLAASLRKKISNGHYKVGDHLPTEHQLCEKHKLSRHTARAALQVLEDEGLIERKPGLGTTVISTGKIAAFSQPLGGLDDLLQYAHKAQLKTTSSETVKLSSSVAQRLGAKRNSSWLVLQGVRVAKGAAIAATTIYISDVFRAKAADFKNPAKAVTEHIETKYGVPVAAITQTIKAEELSEKDANALGAPVHQPILRTIRRYYDAADRLFVISDTRHPSDRFVYEMAYERSERSK